MNKLMAMRFARCAGETFLSGVCVISVQKRKFVLIEYAPHRRPFETSFGCFCCSLVRTAQLKGSRLEPVLAPNFELLASRLCLGTSGRKHYCMVNIDDGVELTE
jgi:hypothetical protein